MLWQDQVYRPFGLGPEMDDGAVRCGVNYGLRLPNQHQPLGRRRDHRVAGPAGSGRSKTDQRGGSTRGVLSNPEMSLKRRHVSRG